MEKPVNRKYIAYLMFFFSGAGGVVLATITKNQFVFAFFVGFWIAVTLVVIADVILSEEYNEKKENRCK